MTCHSWYTTRMICEECNIDMVACVLCIMCHAQLWVSSHTYFKSSINWIDILLPRHLHHRHHQGVSPYQLLHNLSPTPAKSSGAFENSPSSIPAKWINEWMNEWINESINELINESINESINERMNQKK